LAAAASTTLAPGLRGGSFGASRPAPAQTTFADGSLGGLPLAKLRDRYRTEFDEFLDFFDRHVVDRERGGFTCSVNHDGTPINTNKTAWFEGRGIWCYSFMYNHGLAREDKVLDCAHRSVDFIMRHRPAGNDYWPAAYSRDGAVIDRNGGLPGDCYIAEGLAEFSRATGDKKYGDIARETLYRALARYDDPGFKDAASPYPGARNQWYWMLFMWFGTNWLKSKPDAELEKIVDRCLTALLDHHLNPEFDLWNLVINHDLSRPSGENIAHARLAGCGHATEATWMIMYEAVRRKDKSLFDRAAAVFKRHVDVSRDDVYGGVFNDLEDVDENRWGLAKIFWAQAFVLIGSLQAVEHAGAPWARDMFTKQFEYVESRCRLDRWGFPLVIDSADRRVSALPKASRKDIYHHPRYLMLCLEALERMARRGGKTSGVFG
jgi:mannose/cellobiose epimerase-like protein (N-acyl-D-glucosamine 2-epimerase family)